MTDTSPPTVQTTVAGWVTDARRKLDAQTFTSSDLDNLLDAVQRSASPARQRLLYCHASSPSIYSNLVSGAVYEPMAGSLTQIDPMAPELPYNSVHDAIVDGWRVIHFPQQLAPYDDREIDVMGYEFILEKLEVIND